jgi:hypothetical protein
MSSTWESFDHAGFFLLQGIERTPMDMLREVPPVKVQGNRVASRGGDNDEMDALGCPVEYIDLRGSTYENPAVCKYTGNKYYSDRQASPLWNARSCCSAYAMQRSSHLRVR